MTRALYLLVHPLVYYVRLTDALEDPRCLAPQTLEPTSSRRIIHGWYDVPSSFLTREVLETDKTSWMLPPSTLPGAKSKGTPSSM